MHAPGRYLGGTTTRWAIKFESPDGRLVAVGNSVTKDNYQYPGGFRVISAAVVNITHNTFHELYAEGVKINSATDAVVLGNISENSGTSYQWYDGTISGTLVKDHNIPT
jgi:hypothetical protein